MRRTGRVGTLGALGLASALLLSAGCVMEHRPPGPPELPPDAQAALALPQPCRNRVHVVFLSGLFDLTGLKHLRDEVVELGFIKTYAGHSAQKHGLLALVLESNLREPDARFVLVAHGGGAALAPELVRLMQDGGLTVDALVYLEPTGRPGPTGVRTVCLSSKGQTLDDAENLKLDAEGWSITKHPATRAVVVRELVDAGSRVPLPVGGPLLVPGPRGEWDFLKPDGAGWTPPQFMPIQEAMEIGPSGGQQAPPPPLTPPTPPDRERSLTPPAPLR